LSSGLSEDVLFGMNSALPKAADVLKKEYNAKDVLVASLRSNTPHSHWHLIPLHENEEKSWRQKCGHDNGHLFEFLGELEKRGDERAKQERKEKQWDEEKQRFEITRKLRGEVDALRRLTDYLTT
jgi:diadenosine tetraphosphate (Ap4A) HIT family hydrolase